jgi:hypothetical protein
MASLDDESYNVPVIEMERGRKRCRDPSQWRKTLNKSKKYKKDSKVPKCDCVHRHLLQHDGRGRKPKEAITLKS